MKRKIALSIIISLFFVSIANAASLRERLLDIDGVISVDVIEQKTKVFAEKYLITIQQPIDWSNPDSAMFPQRVEIGYRPTQARMFFTLRDICLRTMPLILMTATILRKCTTPT